MCCAGAYDGHAPQCGFCTPVLIMAPTSPSPRARAATIRHELSGQICRCTGYANIVAAVEAAGRGLRRVARSPSWW
jgi:carbon-monoxide dehydrogenase small subunit